MNSRLSTALLATVVAITALASSACIVRARPASVMVQPQPQPMVAQPVAVAAGPQVVATPYYTPQYYNGYVVYYDTVGRPMYYANGGTYYVPQTYVHYRGLVHHYRAHQPVYRRWYTSHGHRYHGYRRQHRRAPVRRGPAPRRPVRRAPRPPTATW